MCMIMAQSEEQIRFLSGKAGSLYLDIKDAHLMVLERPLDIPKEKGRAGATTIDFFRAGDLIEGIFAATLEGIA